MKPLAIITSLLALCACSAPSSPTDDASVSIMTFNVQNLFDNVDDPGKDDKAYLPIEDKQNDAHIAACNEIEVDLSSKNQAGIPPGCNDMRNHKSGGGAALTTG